MMFFIAVFAGIKVATSQNTYIPLGAVTYHELDRRDIISTDTITNFHTSIKPYRRSDVVKFTSQTDMHHSSGYATTIDSFNTQYIYQDNSEFSETTYQNPHTLFKIFYKQPAHFYNITKNDFFVYLNPVIHSEFGFTSDTSSLKFINTRGIELRGGIDHKIGFYLFATDNQAVFPNYINARILSAPQVVPGEGFAKLFKTTGVDYPSTHGYITWNATKHIQMQFGQDKIFIGDGIRSMIWSDNSKDFLFLKINTKIWRLNYQNIFAELGNYNGSNIYNSLVEKKYAAVHHLDINITKNLNIGAFESVIFNRLDTAGNDHGFELYYLNPLIFYRAVESGLGSGDNVLLGIDWKWNMLHHISFYGQFVLDEFLFKELFAGNGWWGNKYAAQLGIKYIDALGISHLDVQYEYNTARPYTYSYENNNGSSYTHYAQALAHPLGANFNEHIISLWYQPAAKFTINNTIFLAACGADSAGTNWGGNIFLDYNTYQNEYGNKTGQGVSTHLVINDFVLSWQFWQNASVDAHFTYRKLNSAIDAMDKNEMYFGIGVRLNEVVKHFDF